MKCRIEIDFEAEPWMVQLVTKRIAQQFRRDVTDGVISRLLISAHTSDDTTEARS